jgi:hypothetical protein
MPGHRTLIILCAPALAAVLAACNGDTPSVGRRASGAAVEAPAVPVQTTDTGTLVFNDASTGTACSTHNRTQACQCDGTPGRQACGSNLIWGSCECLAGPSDGGAAGSGGGSSIASGFRDPPENDLAARFDWLRTEPGAGGVDCKPGRYEGAMDGLYNAPSAFNAPVPIVSVDVTGQPGLVVELAPGGNGEFLVVTGGAVNGTALAIFPFQAEFADGQLDCSTGIFRARLINGSYVVFFDGFYGGSVVYDFEGDIVARYDPATASLVDGRWSVSEGTAPPPAISPDQPPPIFPAAHAGGTGTWTATWAR